MTEQRPTCEVGGCEKPALNVLRGIRLNDRAEKMRQALVCEDHAKYAYFVPMPKKVRT